MRRASIAPRLSCVSRCSLSLHNNRHGIPQEVLQADLFGEYSIEREYKKARLMCVVDLLNEWWGNNTIFFGAQGIDRVWKMRQERRSPRYTTRWGEIVVVRS